MTTLRTTLTFDSLEDHIDQPVADTGRRARLGGTKMGLTATARWIPGTLRQDVLVDGRHRLTTDEPVAIGGEGSAPAPHELLPAALAACASATLVKYAQTKGWDLGDVSVAVDYDHRSTPRRFELEIELTGPVTDEQLQRLRKVVASCPVRRAIESGFVFSEQFRLTDGVASAAQ